MTPPSAYESLHGLGLQRQPGVFYRELATAEWVRRWGGTEATTVAVDGYRGRVLVMRDSDGLWRKLDVATADTFTIRLHPDRVAAATPAEAWARMALTEGLARVALLERQLAAAAGEVEQLDDRVAALTAGAPAAAEPAAAR